MIFWSKIPVTILPKILQIVMRLEGDFIRVQRYPDFHVELPPTPVEAN